MIGNNNGSPGSALAELSNRLTEDLVMIPSASPVRRGQKFAAVTTVEIRERNLQHWRRSQERYRQRKGEFSFSAEKIREALALAQAATVARFHDRRVA